MTNTSTWKDQVENIKYMVSNGVPLENIGKKYGVSRQRMYQVCTQFGIETSQRKRINFLKDKEPKYYWLNRALSSRKMNKAERLHMVENMEVPDYCPMLGNKLNYDEGVMGKEGWASSNSNTPSLDRINPNKGYTLDNVQVISMRANRIKFNASPEELMKIANYMKKVEEGG